MTRLVNGRQSPKDRFQYMDSGDSIFLHVVYGIDLGSSLSGGASVVSLYKINTLLSISCDLQYSFYLASGEIMEDNRLLSKASVEMHSLEMPLLLRINIGTSFYLEVGPQFGLIFYANRTTLNNGVTEMQRPKINIFGLGPVLGTGLDLGRLFVDLRGYFGLIEYVDYEGGRPWSIRLGVGIMY